MLTSMEKHLICGLLGAFAYSLFGGWGLCVLCAFGVFRLGCSAALFFLTGFTWVMFFVQLHLSAMLPENAVPEETKLQGVVSDVVVHGDVLVFELTPVGINGSWHKLNASCYRCTLVMQEGELWSLVLRVMPLRNFYNPGAPDYRMNQLQKGVVANGYVVDQANALRLGDAPISVLGGVRQWIYTVINKDSVNALTRQVVMTLLTGDKNYLSPELRSTLVSAGLIHLFVVSGLHISLVFFLAFSVFVRLLRGMWLLHRPAFLLAGLSAAGVAIFYGALTGFAVPAVRAVFSVCLVAVLAWHMGVISVLRLWLLAVLFVLLINPLAFLGLSAQLSFAVVLAFIYVLSGRKLGKNRGFLLMQLAAFGAGSLLLLRLNMPLPVAGLLLNLLFIPLVSILLLPLALLLLLCAWLGIPSSGVVYILNWLCELTLSPLQQVDWPQLELAWPRVLPVVVGLLFCALPAFFRVRYLGVGLLCMAPWLPLAVNPQDWRLLVFDVGQGSAQLVQVGRRNILIDTGDRYASGVAVADFTLVPALRYLGVKHLDLLLITHHDADHSGGLATIRSRHLLQGPLLTEDDCAGVQWRSGEVSFQVLQAQELRGNNRSCVLWVTSPYGSVLIPGDIERKAEIMLASQLAPVDVLVVPHHGSKTSTSELLLEVVQPSLAVISAGARNRYGHPHQQVLQRLDQHAVSRVSTAADGAVELRFSPRQAGPSVSTYRPDFYPLTEE